MSGRRTERISTADGPHAIVPAPRLAPTEASRRWAALLQQIFEVDPLACPTCHGAMRIVAFITQASVIDRIHTHLRTRAAREAHAGPRSPPSTRAPASRGASVPPARPIGPRRHRPPIGLAVITAHEARERGGGHAAAHLSVLARSVSALFTRPTRIEIPIRIYVGGLAFSGVDADT